MRRIALLLALLFFSGLTFAQEENALWNLFGPEGFGQNKCHYYKLDWQVVETDHFKIYYYDEAVIERQFPELVESIYDEYCQRFQVDSLLRKYEIVIYLTEEHFWSSYILGPYGVLMPEGMYGVFTLDKFLTVATADGDYHAFEHRLRHEMAHLFTMDKVLARVKMARQEARKVWREYQGKKQKITPMDPSLRFNPKKLEEARKKGDSLETPIWPNDIKLLPMPIWWVEGIAEYFSSDYRAQQEDAPFLKDAVLHNWLIPVEHFNQRDGWMVRYVEAPNLLSFIGENKIIELIDSTTILIQ